MTNGPFVVTERENKYVLMIVDGYSKYVVLRAVKDTTVEKTIIYVWEFICQYGRPTKIISDKGTSFMAIKFEKFCREHFIQHVKVASNSPRSNGQVEIVNGIMIRCVSMMTEEDDKTGWDMRLVEVQWSLNNSVSRITKCKPFNVIHNYSTEG